MQLSSTARRSAADIRCAAPHRAHPRKGRRPADAAQVPRVAGHGDLPEQEQQRQRVRAGEQPDVKVGVGQAVQVKRGPEGGEVAERVLHAHCRRAGGWAGGSGGWAPPRAATLCLAPLAPCSRLRAPFWPGCKPVKPCPALLTGVNCGRGGDRQLDASGQGEDPACPHYAGGGLINCRGVPSVPVRACGGMG